MTRTHVRILCAALLLVAPGNLKSIAAPFATSPETVTAPTITTQPANATVAVSKTATFSVVASGTATLAYQWYLNGAIITGATASKYTTAPATDAQNNAYFTVKVSNSAGSVSSNRAVLTVVDPPVIERQPSSVTVATPGVAEFDIDAYATQPLTCQWYKNGHSIANATSCYSYVTEEITTADNGAAFTVIVTETVNGVAISTTSKTATLTVQGSTPIGTYPIVGSWSGTATITGAGSTSTSQVVAAFSQTSYSLTGTMVFTDDNGIPTSGEGIASLNGQNLYMADNDDGAIISIAAGFSSNLLSLNGAAWSADSCCGDGGGSGTLTISSDHNTLKGTGTDTVGDTITWTLAREK